MDAVGPELLVRLLAEQGAALTLYARQWCTVPEDIVQEAFIRLAHARPVPDNLVGWLHRVVRNGAISAARSAARRARRESAAARQEESWFVPARSARIDAEDARAALQTLALDQRETIVLRLWSGLSFEEIAGLTGTTRSTAHRRYTAGLAALREKLNYTRAADTAYGVRSEKGCFPCIDQPG